jgi:hypothetical protein
MLGICYFFNSMLNLDVGCFIEYIYIQGMMHNMLTNNHNVKINSPTNNMDMDIF